MQVITIMPEVTGEYAWLKREDDGSTWVGPNIADSSCGFEFSEFKVSASIEHDFGNWVVRFARGDDDPAFDWPAFNREGIELARRLKLEIGDQARVIYTQPSEDPSAVRTLRTEILADGTPKSIAVTLFNPG